MLQSAIELLQIARRALRNVMYLLKLPLTPNTKCDDYYKFPQYTTVHPVDKNRAGSRQR